MEGFNDLVKEECKRLRPEFDKAKANPSFFRIFEGRDGTPDSAARERALTISMTAETFAKKLLAQNPSLSIRTAIVRIIREEIADPDDMRFNEFSVSGTANYESQERLAKAYETR